MTDDLKNEKTKKFETFSCRVSKETKEELAELAKSDDFETTGQMMRALVDNYYLPVREEKKNNEKVVQLEAKIAEYEKTVEAQTDEIRNLQLKIERFSAECNKEVEDTKAEKEKLQKELVAEIERLQAELQENNEFLENECIVVNVTPLERKCLEYLAARENKERRRKDITPSIFFNYCVSEMLIKGNKYSIDSVPDSVIHRFERELKQERE